ncbi:MAG: translation initiation factor 2 [Tardiphaga sp.]
MRLLVGAVLCVAMGGCASVTRGTTENISIASTPSGATADVAGLDIPTTCVTPCVVQAKRSADIVVTVTKDGFEPQVVPLTKDITGSGGAGFAGNILLGGLVGMGVDAATGAALDHKPNPVIVTLQPHAVAPHVRRAPPRPRPVAPVVGPRTGT